MATTSKKIKTAGGILTALGTLGSIAAVVAAPFTLGTSLLALYATVPIAGIGMLTYAGGGAIEPNNKTGEKPSFFKGVSQFFSSLLKVGALVGITLAATLAIISIPLTLGASTPVVGPLLAPVAAAVTPVVSGIASLLGISGAVSTIATTLLTFAGYIAGGSFVAGLLGRVAHKKMTGNTNSFLPKTDESVANAPAPAPVEQPSPDAAGRQRLAENAMAAPSSTSSYAGAVNRLGGDAPLAPPPALRKQAAGDAQVHPHPSPHTAASAAATAADEPRAANVAPPRTGRR